MESDVENAKEIENYSFLLGSAIRNEDTDQFLSIYDSILPSGLLENQVDIIKKKAREIAELTEEDFTTLVWKARSYSLAQDRDKMSQRDLRSTHYTERHAYYNQDDDSDDNCPASESSIFRVNNDCIIDIPSFPEEEKRTDNDSGIYNSSKATTSLGSNSEDEESEGEERAASFDYFPCRTTKITPMYHNDYDEAYDVDSEKGSQIDIESPRSDKSGNKDSDQDYYQGTEMTTFRTISREQDDFETDDDSDQEVQFAPHRKLYTERRSHNYYTPMTQESCEEYGDMSSATFSFDNSRKALKDQSTSWLRQSHVDDSIHFPLNNSPTPSRYTNYSRYNNSSSAGVRVEKSMYSRHEDMFGGAKDPPFGHGKDQVNKVGQSICTLLTNSSSSVDDMPEGRRIAHDLADDGKKKKKKKRGSKDDLDEKARRNSDYDENGNPIDIYRQMRGSPKLSPGNLSRKTYPGAASSAFPAHFKDLSTYSIGGTPISDLDPSTFHQSHESNRLEKKARKKIKKEKVSLSEEIENYVGNKAIDELLDFIESDKNGRKPKKNTPSISNDVTVVSKSTDKNNKKNKDRKLVKTASDGKCESLEKDDNSETKVIDETTPLINSEKIELTNYKTQSIENHHVEKVCITTECHINAINRMGNNTTKNSSDENTECQGQMPEVREIINDEKQSVPIEKVVMETKSENVLSENGSHDFDKQLKKDKKLQQSQSQKVKAKNSNHKAEDVVIMNGDDTKISMENNSTKSKGVSSNGKHKNSEKNASKVLKSCEHALNGLINNNNKEKAALSYINVLESVQNEDYLFTDFEPLRKEPEFTVVGKKKKKLTTPSLSSTKDTVSAKETLVPPKPAKREERRNPPRSITPPPSNKLSSNIEIERTRDLSPSAFPALGSSNQSSFRDARRNSTGDVRTEVQSIVKAQDDSDIESVKSLPASSQGAWGQTNLSPRLPVSYAKMAASPKPSVTSLESSTNEDDTEETNMDLKAAIWKGQIKERRHSIGSHPENVKDMESSSVKQKYGSQEVLNICDQDVVLVDSDFPKVGFNAKSESKTVYDSKEIKENVTSLCNDSVSVVSNNLSETNIINSSLKDKCVSHPEPAKQKDQDIDENFPELDKSSESSCDVSNSRKNNEINNVEKVKLSKQTLNNSKKVKQSVIFMDKRVSQAPKNLGISFFFDSDESKDVEVDDLKKCSSKLENSNKIIPNTSNSVNHRTSDTASVIDTSKNSNKFETEFYSKTHTLAGKNGIVDHIVNPNVQNKTHPHNDDAIIFISEPNPNLYAATISSDLTNDSKKQQQSPDSRHSASQDNVIQVLIADKIEREPNSLPKDTKCKQQLFYRQGSGDTSGNQRFNFPEAVGYLYREWEKALEGSRKYPNEVVIFKC